MNILKIIRLSITKTKNARAMQKLHPIAFNALLILSLLFYSPLILFSYVRNRKRLIKIQMKDW